MNSLEQFHLGFRFLIISIFGIICTLLISDFIPILNFLMLIFFPLGIIGGFMVLTESNEKPTIEGVK